MQVDSWLEVPLLISEVPLRICCPVTIVHFLVPSCKLKLVRFSAQMRIQDGARVWQKLYPLHLFFSKYCGDKYTFGLGVMIVTLVYPFYYCQEEVRIKKIGNFFNNLGHFLDSFPLVVSFKEILYVSNLPVSFLPQKNYVSLSKYPSSSTGGIHSHLKSFSGSNFSHPISSEQ